MDINLKLFALLLSNNFDNKIDQKSVYNIFFYIFFVKSLSLNKTWPLWTEFSFSFYFPVGCNCVKMMQKSVQILLTVNLGT